MRQAHLVPATSLALATLGMLVLAFTLLNGYALNLAGGYRANPWLVLAGVLVELAVVLTAARRWVRVEFDPLELAGYLVVVAGVWLYFIAAAWPTLLPPTLSVDAVRHYTQALFSYPNGTLVSWYPAGGAFIIAMFSRWLDAPPLRMLHPVAALFIALTAGAVYGMTVALLPRTRASRIAALAAPALLFVPWSYFAGMIDWEQYFFAQAFAQYFVVMALWYLVAYVMDSRGLHLALFGLAVLGTVAAYPYLVALPLAVFALVTLVRLARGNVRSVANRGALVSLGALAILLVLAAVALERGGILELATARIASASDVGEGGVTNPSLDAFGGPLLLLLAAAGLVPAWRAGAGARTLVGFLAAWLLQLAALLLVRPVFQISGYRVDKTFYVLVFPLAILGALAVEWVLSVTRRVLLRQGPSPRRNGVEVRWSYLSFAAAVLLLAGGVLLLRPPKPYAPFTESELQVALWAKDNLDTYKVHALDTQMTRAYWLAVGLWRETLPNEWFQWIPAGPKLGPATYQAWLNDRAWGDYLMVSDVTTVPAPLPAIAYRVGNAAILKKSMPLTADDTPSHAETWYYESTVKLLGYDLPRTTLAAGETVELMTYSTPLYPPPATIDWRLELVDRNGKVAAQANARPFQDRYPVERWHPGPLFADRWTLALDPNLPPGAYDLHLGLYRRTDGEFTDVHPLASPQAPQIHLPAAPLGTIKVALPPPTPDELDAATRLGSMVGQDVQLLAYRVEPNRTARTLHLTLYWQSVAKTSTDYTEFVHLLDSAGKIVAQQDAQPRGGAYPTSIWDPSEIVKEEYNFSVPADAALPTSIEIGMYTQPDGRRLPAGGDDKLILNSGF